LPSLLFPVRPSRGTILDAGQGRQRGLTGRPGAQTHQMSVVEIIAVAIGFAVGVWALVMLFRMDK
jgi:hypothetical protein